MATETNLTCWICNKPVPITVCKIDEHGNAVHEQCSVARMTLRDATQQQGKRPSSASPTRE